MLTLYNSSPLRNSKPWIWIDFSCLAQIHVTLDAVGFIVLLIPCWQKYDESKNTGFAIQLPFRPLLKQISETAILGSTTWLN